MRPTRSCTLATALLVAGATAFGAQAATSSDNPIAAAVAPAPPALRDTATVLGWQEDGTMRVLRQGEGELTCLADNPADERFHVACYHNALEPFMARGRELRREGKEREELLRVREEEIASGKLEMPNGPTALYSLTGPADSFDSVTGEVKGGTRVSVVYVPFATEASTGLPPEPAVPGGPWIMNPGKPWAHIMVVQPSESPKED